MGAYLPLIYFRLRRPTRKTTTNANTAMIIHGNQEPVVVSVTTGLGEGEVANVGVATGVRVAVGVSVVLDDTGISRPSASRGTGGEGSGGLGVGGSCSGE